jgi:hypothetical protein
VSEDFTTRMTRLALQRCDEAYKRADAWRDLAKRQPTPETAAGLRRAVEDVLYAIAWADEWGTA